MWSLQILAFISKYTNLRRQLSETFIINGLSLRTFNTNPPPLEMDNNEDNDYIDDDLNEYIVPEPAVTSKFGYQDGTEDDLIDEQNSQADYRSILASIENDDNHKHKAFLKSYMEILNETDRIAKATKLEKFALDVSRLAHRELNDLRIKNRTIYKDRHQTYNQKWNYNSNWDNFDMDFNNQHIDQDTIPIKKLNIFPLVEKFTVKHLYTQEISYWAAVIVRNSNRRDDSMGGRRQCAYFGCGKWEDTPRQFAKCRRCKRAKYCSKECQSKAWTYHKYWCNTASSSTGSTTSGSTSSTATGSTSQTAAAAITATTSAGSQQVQRAHVHNHRHVQAQQSPNAAGQGQSAVPQHSSRAPSSSQPQTHGGTSLGSLGTSADQRQGPPLPQQLQQQPQHSLQSNQNIALASQLSGDETRVNSLANSELSQEDHENSNSLSYLGINRPDQMNNHH
ncbi:unnamed protein product [Ambrosiozyma monospora]|uniref:Unnamed protein product n=1 Tax=Ambrosiozyma monospora TaxID=43982 RepID=A0A9W6Z2K0_AMBMO|nr:unnamed protein product [Ambrosiozyma monospora]